MEDWIEEIFTGYCKTNNQTRIVTCEYSQQPYGLHLETVDCNYSKCVHSGNCDVIKQVLARENE